MPRQSEEVILRFLKPNRFTRVYDARPSSEINPGVIQWVRGREGREKKEALTPPPRALIHALHISNELFSNI